MSKNGLRLKEKKKSDDQKTLEEAFEAGQMYRRAKEIKKNVLQGTRRFMVSLIHLNGALCDVNRMFTFTEF